MRKRGLSRLRVGAIAVLAVSSLALLVIPGPAALAQSSSLNSFAPGPGATQANTYVGNVDTPAPYSTVNTAINQLVSGWALDTTAQGWAGFDQVQVYNGQMGGGGTLLASGSVGESRPDVAATLGNPSAATSGFSVVLPASALAGLASPLNVYLHTPDNGWWVLSQPVLALAATGTPQVASPAQPASLQQSSGNLHIAVVTPTTNESLDIQTQSTLIGFAYSSTGAPIQRVEVYLDSQAGDHNPIDLGSANLGDSNGVQPPLGFPPDSGFSFRFNATVYPPSVNNPVQYPNGTAPWPAGGNVLNVYAYASDGGSISIPVHIILQ